MTGIVFDLDGTLIDSLPDLHAVANRVLGEEGLPPQSIDQVRGFIGRGVPWLVGQLLDASGGPADGPRHDRMVASFEDHYMTATGLTHPYPGVEEALAKLRASGHGLALCTNKSVKPTGAVLDHLGLARFFDAVIGGDTLAQRKPDPAPVRAAVEALGGGPAIYVGDGEADETAAHAAGLPFVLFTQGYRRTPVEHLPHEAAFSDYADLPALIARLQG